MGGLTQQQLENARADFLEYDANDNGRVSVEEFTLVMIQYLSAGSVESLLTLVNRDGDDEISWEEFLAEFYG
ncbi:MAG: EF-hand domain-containing protein [Pseudomonas prosekii]